MEEQVRIRTRTTVAMVELRLSPGLKGGTGGLGFGGGGGGLGGSGGGIY